MLCPGNRCSCIIRTDCLSHSGSTKIYKDRIDCGSVFRCGWRSIDSWSRVVASPRAVKPSSYISVYCLFKIATGILQPRAQPFQPCNKPAQCLLLTVILSRAVLLLAESWPKRSFLITPDAFTPEETSGVFEKSLLKEFIALV